jgi:HSP20 family molecular chaperone IbpA
MPENTTSVAKDKAEPATPERTRGGNYFVPRVDIVETDHELLVLADMPGVRPDDVDLRYEGGELMLHGRLAPRQHSGHALLREYDEGDFYRVFQIHESIDSSKIEASCKNGVLTIRLPKAEAVRPRQVKVTAQ